VQRCCAGAHSPRKKIAVEWFPSLKVLAIADKRFDLPQRNSQAFKAVTGYFMDQGPPDFGVEYIAIQPATSRSRKSLYSIS